jgi:hypothetical protein
MCRSVLASLIVMSLALIVVPCSAQQPSPAVGPRPSAQPNGVVTQQDCPKVIAEINAATNVRFDPLAATARQTAGNAARLQTEGKYVECFSTALATRDLLVASSPSPVVVYPDYDDPRAWAHPNEEISWVRRQQGP